MKPEPGKPEYSFIADKRSHSRLGIASSVASVIAAMSVLAIYLASSTWVGNHGQQSDMISLVGGISFVTGVLSIMAAFILGIAPLFQRTKQNTYGVYGLIVAIMCGVILLGEVTWILGHAH